METLFQIKGFTVLLELFMKSSLVMAIALGLSLLARKQGASFRHFLLGISLLGLLVLPFISTFLPGWRTGLLPSWIMQSGNPTPSPCLETCVQLQAHISPGAPFAAQDYWFLKPRYRAGVTVLWLLVSSFMLVKILFGLYGVYTLTRQGVSMNGSPWQEIFLGFLEKISLKRNVRLIKNERVSMPMTWGILNPVVLMPPASVKWPVEECSSVLFHELSHIKRGDFLVLLLCRIACSLYWLNPLSWMVFRLLRKEQEKACDEMVLKAGIKPSTYASTLLRLRQSVDKGHYIHPIHPIPSQAVGMASNSELSERLTTILEKKIKTKEIKMKTKLMLLVLVLLTVTIIGTAKPEQTQPTVKPEQASADKTTAAEPTCHAKVDQKCDMKAGHACCEGENKTIVIIIGDGACKEEKGKCEAVAACSGDSKEKKPCTKDCCQSPAGCCKKACCIAAEGKDAKMCAEKYVIVCGKGEGKEGKAECKEGKAECKEMKSCKIIICGDKDVKCDKDAKCDDKKDACKVVKVEKKEAK